MYFDYDESWSDLLRDADHVQDREHPIQEALERIMVTDQKLWHRLIRPFLNHHPPVAGNVRVHGIRYKRLPFFHRRPLADRAPGHLSDALLLQVLLEPTAAEGGADAPGAGEVLEKDRPRLFFLALPTLEQSDDKGKGVHEVLHLDGTIPPLYHACAHLDGIDLEQAAEYLDFFTSVVAGDGWLFGFVQASDIVVPEPAGENDLVPPHIGASLLARATLEYLPETSGDSVAHEVDFDQENVLRKSSIRYVIKQAHQEIGELLSMGTALEAPGTLEPDQPFLDRLFRNGREQAHQEQMARTMATARDDEEQELVGAVIRYGRNLFQAVLQVNQGGYVHMVADRMLLPRYGALPIESWRVSDHSRQLGLARTFYRVAPIEQESDEAAERMLDHARLSTEQRLVAGRPADRPRPVRGASVTHALNWQGETLYGPIEFIDCDFHDDVVLSHALVERGLTFRNCRFLGSLRLEHTQVKGPLVIEGCTISGLRDRQLMRSLRRRFRDAIRDRRAKGRSDRTDTGDLLGGIDETVAADLGGMQVAGELRIERTTVHGTMSLRGTVVRGRGSVTGCAVWPFHQLPEWIDDPSLGKPLRLGLRFLDRGAALDLRSAHFVQGLSLSAWFHPNPREEEMLETGACKPALVVGTVRAEHLFVGEGLELSGLICTDLAEGVFDARPTKSNHGRVLLTDAEIGGQLQTWSSGTRPNDAWKYLRTVVSYLDLTRARIRSGDLRGVCVEQSISARGLRCDGVLDLTPIGLHRIESAPDIFTHWRAPTFRGASLLALPADALRRDRYTVARFGRTQVGGSLDLTGATVDKDLYLDGAFIERDIHLNDTDLGGLSAMVHVSAILGHPNSEIREFVRNSDEARSGPEEHLHANTVGVAFTPIGTTDDALEPSGLLTLATQARRMHLRDATVRGAVKLAGSVLRGKESPDDAAERIEVLQESLNRARSANTPAEQTAAFKVLLGSVDAPTEPARPLPDLSAEPSDPPTATSGAPAGPEPRWTDTLRRDALRITNTNIAGPVLLYQEGFHHTIAARITRSTWDWSSFERLLQVEDDDRVVSDEMLEERLRHWLPPWAVSSRVLGGVRLHEARIDGQLDIRGAIIDGHLDISDVELSSDFNVLDASHGPIFAARVNLDTLRTPSDVCLDHLVTGELQAPNMDIGGRLHLNHVTIQGDARLPGSRCDVLKISTSTQGNTGTLDLSRCTIDELVLSNNLPARLTLRTTAIKRISADPTQPGSGIAEEHAGPDGAEDVPSFELVQRVLGRTSGYDSKVFAMFEQLLRTEGDDLGADAVAKRKEKAQLKLSWRRLWKGHRSSKPTEPKPARPVGVLDRALEYSNRQLFAYAGAFGRAIMPTLAVGTFTIYVSLCVAGHADNWNNTDDYSPKGAVLFALETGFPPFARTEGEDPIMHPRREGPTYLAPWAFVAVGSPTSTADAGEADPPSGTSTPAASIVTDSSGPTVRPDTGPRGCKMPLAPHLATKGLRATSFVIWSWFLLVATGLMRRGGGNVAS